jgi:putative transposase
MGRDRLSGALCDVRLLILMRWAKHKTANSHQRFRRHPKRLTIGERRTVTGGTEQRLVADISLPTQGTFMWFGLIDHA